MTLGVSQQVRLNFSLQVGEVATTVEVSVANGYVAGHDVASIGTVFCPNFSCVNCRQATATSWNCFAASAAPARRKTSSMASSAAPHQRG